MVVHIHGTTFVRKLTTLDRDAIERLCSTDEDYGATHLQTLIEYDFDTDFTYGLFYNNALAGIAGIGLNDSDVYVISDIDKVLVHRMGVTRDNSECWVIISGVFIQQEFRGKGLALDLIKGIMNDSPDAYIVHPICDKLKAYYKKSGALFDATDRELLIGIGGF